jgi:hypothetical protein
MENVIFSFILDHLSFSISILLPERVANSDYENCSKKLRQLVHNSCAESLDKRRAILVQDIFYTDAPNKPARQTPSPSVPCGLVFKHVISDMFLLRRLVLPHISSFSHASKL